MSAACVGLAARPGCQSELGPCVDSVEPEWLVGQGCEMEEASAAGSSMHSHMASAGEYVAKTLCTSLSEIVKKLMECSRLSAQWFCFVCFFFLSVDSSFFFVFFWSSEIALSN